MQPDKVIIEKRERRSVFSWCMYDWANTAFSTVIITFIYSVYFEQMVIGDTARGTAMWTYALAASGILIALISPVLGAIADHYGARKRWLTVFMLISVMATAMLWFGMPNDDPRNVMFILVTLVIANTACDVSVVVNNAMLPHITPRERIGRVSGWAWGLGYVGGLVCLVIALFGLVGLGDMAPWIALPRDEAEHLRATGPLVAVWYLIFTLPLLLFTRDVARTGLNMMQALRQGLRQLATTVRQARKHGNLVRFLIASALYRDGLNTLFAVGGLYAAGTFGMGFEEILVFAIGLNVTAGIGAGLFAFLDDRIGSRRTVLISLVSLMALGTAILLIDDKLWFIILALGLGTFMGPVQAASRTLAARLSPPEMSTQTYGLYALTGKSISFLGPFLFGWATLTFDSQRAGMMTILLFWLAGYLLLLGVREARK